MFHNKRIKHVLYLSFSEIFSEESERMGSEESVGSAELKKILDSFEAGEVLPEVRPLCFRIQNGPLSYV